MAFEVIAYEDVNGKVPVQDFLKNLNPKMRAKMYGMLVILQEKGNMLREPYSKYIEEGIFELRCKFGSDITRVIAKSRRTDFMERMAKNENLK